MLKNIFSPDFYHQNTEKMQKNVLKSQALGRDAKRRNP